RCRAEGVSKAWVADRVGSDSALSSERAHTMKVLPLGVLRALASIRPTDLSGAGRAAAIVAGLGYTATSYLRESRRRARRSSEVADGMAVGARHDRRARAGAAAGRAQPGAAPDRRPRRTVAVAGQRGSPLPRGAPAGRRAGHAARLGGPGA